MVPVPEELVGQVKAFLDWGLNEPKVAENPEAVRTVLNAADDQLRRLVLHIASVTDEDGTPTITEAGAATDMTPREVMGSLGDLHQRLAAAGRRNPLTLPRPDPSERPEEVAEYAHRLLHMSAADAAAILDF